MKDDGLFRSINHGRCWYKSDPFILAAQATKVFYLKDNKHAVDTKSESWRIVQKFSHRHLWNVAEKNNDDERTNDSTLSYQDDSCEGFQVQGTLDDEENLDHDAAVVDEDCLHVDAAVVDELRSKNQEEIEEDYPSDDDDETRWQYASNDEGRTTLHIDDEEEAEEEEDSDDD